MSSAESAPRRPAFAAGLALAICAAALAAAAAPVVVPTEREVARSRQVQLRQMDPAGRSRLLRHVRDWDALPPGQRLERRARYAAWRQLAPPERAQLRATAAQVAGFEPQRVQALRAQFDALDSVQQRAWRLGPQLGRLYPALQPLLAYAPGEQRHALLATLRAMPAAEHRDLAVLVQRVPPQERQAFRDELLRTAPAQRAAWLKRRLAQ